MTPDFKWRSATSDGERTRTEAETEEPFLKP